MGGIRSEIVGYSYEDTDGVHKAFHNRLGTKYEYRHPNLVPVGLIRGGGLEFRGYPTVLHALGDGWRLLGPPTSFKEKWGDEEVDMSEWWLVKE